MVRKSVIILAVIAAIVILGFIFRGKVAAVFQHSRATQAASSPSAPAEKKVLYWYDAMNPTHTYDKPGKAPDGMDLVPKYAEDETASSSASAEHSGHNSGEKKILFWYDPMHPAYKARQARDCP